MSRLIFWLLVGGSALYDQMDIVAIALAIGALGSWTGRLATYEPCVLDAMVQSIFDHRIIPVDEGRQTVLALKAYLFGFTKTDPVDRLERAACQRLSEHSV